MTFITIYSLDKNASSKRQMVASNLEGEYPFHCFNLFWHVDDNLQLVTFCDTLQSASASPSIPPFLVYFVDTRGRHVRMIFVLLVRLYHTLKALSTITPFWKDPSLHNKIRVSFSLKLCYSGEINLERKCNWSISKNVQPKHKLELYWILTTFPISNAPLR